MSEGYLLHLLRNASVRDLERALLRDGFVLKRKGPIIYRHPDGRVTVIHYHHGSDRMKRGTLGGVLAAVGWTVEDARRLGLIS